MSKEPMITFVTFHIECNQKAADHIAKENILLNGQKNYMIMIELLFRSASLFHPNCRKVVVTDLHTDCSGLPADIQIYRLELDSEKVMLSRLLSQIDYLKNQSSESDVIWLDSDMLVNGKLDSVFDRVFDVGVTHRKTDDMPINGGILFFSLKRRQAVIDFLEKVHFLYRSKYADQSTWWGDQYALVDAIGQEHFTQHNSDLICVDNANLLLLPCDIYNFSPNNKYRAIALGLKNKKVIHFKGYRKRLMPIYWDTYLKPREFSRLSQLFSSVLNWVKLLSNAFQEVIPTGLFLIAHTFRRSKEMLLNPKSQ